MLNVPLSNGFRDNTTESPPSAYGRNTITSHIVRRMYIRERNPGHETMESPFNNAR